MERRRQGLERFTTASVVSTPTTTSSISLSSPASSTTSPPTPTPTFPTPTPSSTPPSTTPTSIDATEFGFLTTVEPPQALPATCSTPSLNHDTKCSEEWTFATSPAWCSTYCLNHDSKRRYIITIFPASPRGVTIDVSVAQHWFRHMPNQNRGIPWTVLAHVLYRVPWPPPLMNKHTGVKDILLCKPFGMMTDCVQLRPMPWPSFTCHTTVKCREYGMLLINTWGQYELDTAAEPAYIFLVLFEGLESMMNFFSVDYGENCRQCHESLDIEGQINGIIRKELVSLLQSQFSAGYVLLQRMALSQLWKHRISILELLLVGGIQTIKMAILTISEPQSSNSITISVSVVSVLERPIWAVSTGYEISYSQPTISCKVLLFQISISLDQWPSFSCYLLIRKNGWDCNLGPCTLGKLPHTSQYVRLVLLSTWHLSGIPLHEVWSPGWYSWEVSINCLMSNVFPAVMPSVFLDSSTNDLELMHVSYYSEKTIVQWLILGLLHPKFQGAIHAERSFPPYQVQRSSISKWQFIPLRAQEFHHASGKDTGGKMLLSCIVFVNQKNHYWSNHGALVVANQLDLIVILNGTAPHGNFIANPIVFPRVPVIWFSYLASPYSRPMAFQQNIVKVSAIHKESGTAALIPKWIDIFQLIYLARCSGQHIFISAYSCGASIIQSGNIDWHVNGSKEVTDWVLPLSMICTGNNMINCCHMMVGLLSTSIAINSEELQLHFIFFELPEFCDQQVGLHSSITNMILPRDLEMEAVDDIPYHLMKGVLQPDHKEVIYNTVTDTGILILIFYNLKLDDP